MPDRVVRLSLGRRASNIRWRTGAARGWFSDGVPSRDRLTSGRRDAAEMKRDNEQTPPKLVYLRDRAARAAAERSRKTPRKVVVRQGDEFAGEALWLGRSLFVVAASIVVYCVLISIGSVPLRDTESRYSLVSLLAGDFFAGIASAVAGVLLLRNGKRAPLHVALAAGALIVVAVQGLTHLVVAGDLGELTLAGRLEVLMMSAAIALGVWAVSYLVRSSHRPESP